jgi:ectoine hydroxylase-related dioxygenase (phytanoyl-CoA dioxygenase family)
MLVWIPFHNIENQRTISVVPESHYYGLLPNRNRKILPLPDFSMPDPLPIVDIEPGDALFFHPMLVHKTAARGSQIRYAMHFTMRNSNAPLTKQQQAFGYIGIRQGAMTKIRHILGNDYFTPLRVYGGNASNFDRYIQDQ